MPKKTSVKVNEHILQTNMKERYTIFAKYNACQMYTAQNKTIKH